MVLKNKIIWGAATFVVASVFIFSFQNCSGARFLQDGSNNDANNLAQCTDQNCRDIEAGHGSCQFNGQTIAHGQFVDAFPNSTVPQGQTCNAERRTCNNGVLSGSASFASCSVSGGTNPPTNQSCLFNGISVAHGQSVNAFIRSTEPAGGTCASESRTCNNGQLSGSYQFSSCQVAAPASCLFNGTTVASGSVVTAFQNSTVASGSSCVSEIRLCTDGVLNGSYAYSSCTPAAPAACQFNGMTIPSGSTVQAYLESTVAFGATCTSESRVCSNGVLSGSYTYSSCVPGAPAACTFQGQTIAHGADVTAFQNSTVQFGQTCVGEKRTCQNGVLSGSYNSPCCSPGAPASCTFDGRSLAHGEEVTAFQNSSVAFGGTCSSEKRTCSNGQLSGSFTFGSCTVGAPASCLFNGQSVAHGSSVQAFQTSSVDFGQSCTAQTRTCANGVLSGSATFSSCTVGAARSCTFNGRNIAHGESVYGYAQSSVPFGQSCLFQERVCNNGTLSGSYTFGSCALQAPQSCSFNGRTVAHGEVVYAFQNSTVGYGQSCTSEARVCNNGQLSGSYQWGTCSISTPACCMINGSTMCHGQAVTMYQTANVAFGGTCQSENRTCNNGSLSGSYTNSSCVVQNPASCTFNGQSIPHGSSVQAFQSSSVPFGQTCRSETRSCNNGVLSGSLTAGNCQILGPAACVIQGQVVAHGGSITAYTQQGCYWWLAPYYEVTRTCNNGTLSGSGDFIQYLYGASNCTH